MVFSKGKIKNIGKIMNADMFKPLINIESGIIIILIVGFSLLFAYTLFVKTSIIEGASNHSHTKGDTEGATKGATKEDTKGDTKEDTHTNQALNSYASNQTSDATTKATQARSGIQDATKKLISL